MEIPNFLANITKTIEKSGFEAFIVGGSVRDLIMNRNISDWDITTNAKPEEILEIFPDGKYENQFGTVILPIRDSEIEIKSVEITTYRSEHGYSDRRHPDQVIFENSLEKDLARRDFTVNALAMAINKIKPKAEDLKLNDSEIRNISINGQEYAVIDLFGGLKDIKNGVIRAVGEPADRFKEDALRMIRAIRFFSQLGFEIEPKTERAIIKLAGNIKYIANERIREEFIKILKSKNAFAGVELLHKIKLLQYIIPELERGVGVEQNRHHIYTVFKHNLLALKYCPSDDWRVKLAALLHDIAKPQTKRLLDGDATFYNHDMIGAKTAEKIMKRLKFSSEDIEKIANLIRYHMFYYNVGEVTESSVRRLIAKVGEQNLKDLIDLRIADRLGSGVPKGKPYKLRHLEYMMKKVRHDPISVKMLAINGNNLMELLKIEPGPKIGAILDVLLSEVIENPALNEKIYLLKRAGELNSFDLNSLRLQAKEKIIEKKMEDDMELKKEFYVK